MSYYLIYNYYIENIEDFYKKIVKAYKENKYKNFFNYFKKTWLGKTIPKNFGILVIY